MYDITRGSGNQTPLMPQDGAVLHMEGADGNLGVTCCIQLAGLEASEIRQLRRGRLKAGFIRARSSEGSFPVFAFKFGNIAVEAPYCLGLEAHADKEAIKQALKCAGKLSRQSSWSLAFDFVDRYSNTSVGARLVGPSPHFWQRAATAILASDGIDRNRRDRILSSFHEKIPSPDYLLRKLKNCETFTGSV